jgi:hypothetical protein
METMIDREGAGTARMIQNPAQPVLAPRFAALRATLLCDHERGVSCSGC